MHTRRDTMRQVPPGPRGELPLDSIRREPLEFLRQLADTYGDIVRYRTPWLQATMLNDPRAVRHVLHAGPGRYTKAGTPDLMMLKPMLGDALMTSEGASWQRQRHQLQPAFVRQRIDALAPLMVEATLAVLKEWESRPDVSEPLEICTEMTELTLRIVARALFSYDVSRESGRFGRAVQTLNETIGHPDPSDREIAARFRDALGTLQRIVEEVIAQRADIGSRGGDDLLGLLLESVPPHVTDVSTRLALREQVLTFLLAGHETTAKALSWTIYLLGEHPRCAARLRAEVDRVVGARRPTVGDLAQMPYVWQVLQESMRLYPPIWIVSRLAVVADEIDGFEIPSGSLVCMSPFLIHRHPAYWPDPHRFDPDRFRPASAPTAYLPFGAGPRQCIGRHFAQVELQLVLITLVQSCSLHLVSGHPVEPEALVTLRPRHGLPMVVRPAAGTPAAASPSGEPSPAPHKPILDT